VFNDPYRFLRDIPRKLGRLAPLIRKVFNLLRKKFADRFLKEEVSGLRRQVFTCRKPHFDT
jgi:hypothetical protein